MDQSLLSNLKIGELSFDYSITAESNEVGDSVNTDKSDIAPVSPMTVSDGNNPKSNMNVNSEEYYYNVIKPRCPNLEFSYSELFSDRMKEPGFIKEFVAKRIAAALDKVKKSQSLLTLNESQDKNHFNEGFLNSSNIQRSLDCLNESFSNNLGTPLNTSLPKANNDTYVATECHKLRKSLSFSGFSNLNKNESLIDMEMELEDSVPSEDEKDEMGLPVRKFLFCGTPQKKHDITETIQKYKKILRESFSEPSDGVDNYDEEEVPAPTYANQPAASLLSDVQDVHLKKTTSKAAAKGPMKALMPLQNMTKQVGALLSSPFKKKKVKMVNGPNKDSSHISDDSFNFLESQPVAVSTPTSGSRKSGNDSISSKNRSFQRSFSEERVSKKTCDITQVISKIKSSTTSQMSALHNTRTINNTEKTSTKSAPVNNTRNSIASTSKTVRSSGLKRPSTAPVRIKAPLTTKLSSTNMNQISKFCEITKPSTSKMNTNRNVSTSKSVLNSTRTIKSSVCSDKKTLLTKLRKPSSYINKENY